MQHFKKDAYQVILAKAEFSYIAGYMMCSLFASVHIGCRDPSADCK